MPYRILFVSPVAIIGGAERSLIDLIRYLDRSRFSPEVVLFGDGPLAGELAHLGIPTTIIEAPRAMMSLSLRGTRPSIVSSLGAVFGGIVMVARLARVLRRGVVSVVHTNGLKAQLIAGVAARVARSGSVLWHVRDLIGQGLPERLMLAIGSRCSDVIVANSSATRAAIERRVGCGITTIHNGVDVQTFRDDLDGRPFRQELGIGDEPVVGMVGMLAPWKGHHVFLRAAHRVASRMPNVKFVIVGDEIYVTEGHGGYKGELLRLAAELSLGSSVTFTGYRHDMPQVMSSFDVLVHASVRPEPFGRVLIEAMACGKPVIATRAGGAVEIVVHGDSGVLVPPDDSEAMAAAIERLLHAPTTCKAMGDRGRQRAVQTFSARQHAAAIERIYTSMVATPA